MLLVVLPSLISARVYYVPDISVREGAWYDVRSYGAAGTGLIDDQPEIQAAIDAAEDATNPGTVFFPPGQYLISSPLVLNERVNIVGVGFGSQIHQSADDHLFDATSSIQYLNMEGLLLTSEATTAGKSLLELLNVHDSSFTNIFLRGSYYGIHVYGCLRNVFTNIVTYRGPTGMLPGVPSNMECQIYSEQGGGQGANSNDYIACKISSAVGIANRGFYFATGTGGFTITGGTMEGHAGYIPIEVAANSAYALIEGVHLEGATNCLIYRAGQARISGIYSSGEVVIYGPNAFISNGYIAGLTLDKEAWNVTVNGVHIGASGITNDSSGATITNITSSAGYWAAREGRQNRSVRNIVDGDVEVWISSLPIGFANDNSATVEEETTLYMFGSSSCKVTVGGGQTRGGIYYELSGDNFKELTTPDLTNIRNSDYQWTLSGSGTAEYYLEASGGGDPSITFQPWAVLLNGTPVIEDSADPLAQSRWDYDDNDALGYNTVYVRLSDDTDPDSKTTAYVQAAQRRHYITASAWVYVPETNGGAPSIYEYKSGGIGASFVVTTFTVPTEEWTRIVTTRILDPKTTADRIEFGVYGGSAGDIVYFDGIEIVPGDAASPGFDDSRGLDSDFRVGGDLRVEGDSVFVEAQADSFVAGTGVFGDYSNLMLSSEEFDDAGVYTYNAVSVILAVDDTSSPRGTVTAERVYDNVANAFSRQVLQVVTGSTAADTQYTFSCWIQSAGGATTQVQTIFNDAGGAGIQAAWHTVTASWTRISQTATFGNGAVRQIGFGQVCDTNDINGIYMWGGQLAAGSSSGGYAQTTSATVSGEGIVTVDGVFGGDLTVAGQVVFTPSGAQAITAVGDAILANATMVVLNPDADYTLTSTPTIADGAAGQIIYVTCENAEANTVTVQDQDTLAGSNLQLGGVNRAVSGKDVLCLLFDGTDWLEVSWQNN
jgi:hypothetical protein